MLKTLKEKLPLVVAIASLAMSACVVGAVVFLVCTSKASPVTPVPVAKCDCGDSCVCHPCALKHYPSQAGPFSTVCPYCRRGIVVRPTGQLGDIEAVPE